jgi:hypothetical protein
MTTAMEIHDSRLLEIECDCDGKGFALFHAVVFRSEGVVFKDAQESGWQNLRFQFEGMRIEGKIVELDEYAYDGNLWVNGSNENGVISLPANHSGDVCLEMSLSPTFETIKIHASRISSALEGEFELEAIWDADGSRTRAR